MQKIPSSVDTAVKTQMMVVGINNLRSSWIPIRVRWGDWGLWHSTFAALAVEHQKPKRAHSKFDRQVKEEDGARHAIDDEAKNPPEGQRVSEEHGPDHRHMPPLRRERGDDAEGHHAEIEAHKGPEDVGLIGAFYREVHELREGRCRIDAIAQRDRKEEHPATKRKSFIMSCSPREAGLGGSIRPE